jgi:hypothetical protein
MQWTQFLNSIAKDKKSIKFSHRWQQMQHWDNTGHKKAAVACPKPPEHSHATTPELLQSTIELGVRQVQHYCEDMRSQSRDQLQSPDVLPLKSIWKHKRRGVERKENSCHEFFQNLSLKIIQLSIQLCDMLYPFWNHSNCISVWLWSLVM